MAHGGRQRGGWTHQCSGTDPGAVQPARDGRVRHSYPYPSAPQARSLAAPDDQSHAVRPLPQDGPRGSPHLVSREAAVSRRGRTTRTNESRTEFAEDSSLEGTGFEPSVPGRDENERCGRRPLWGGARAPAVPVSRAAAQAASAACHAGSITSATLAP